MPTSKQFEQQLQQREAESRQQFEYGLAHPPSPEYYGTPRGEAWRAQQRQAFEQRILAWKARERERYAKEKALPMPLGRHVIMEESPPYKMETFITEVTVTPKVPAYFGRHVETEAAPPIQTKEYLESIRFYEGIGYPQYGGIYAPFTLEPGYKVKVLKETTEGLQVELETFDPLFGKPFWTQIPSIADWLYGESKRMEQLAPYETAVGRKPSYGYLKVAAQFARPFDPLSKEVPSVSRALFETARITPKATLPLSTEAVRMLSYGEVPISQQWGKMTMGEAASSVMADIFAIYAYGKALQFGATKIRKASQEWLTTRYIEKGPLEYKGTAEKIVMRLTGAKPYLAPEIVAAPTTTYSYETEYFWGTMQTPKTAELWISKTPIIKGYKALKITYLPSLRSMYQQPRGWSKQEIVRQMRAEHGRLDTRWRTPPIGEEREFKELFVKMKVEPTGYKLWEFDIPSPATVTKTEMVVEVTATGQQRAIERTVTKTILPEVSLKTVKVTTKTASVWTQLGFTPTMERFPSIMTHWLGKPFPSRFPITPRVEEEIYEYIPTTFGKVSRIGFPKVLLTPFLIFSELHKPSTALIPSTKSVATSSIASITSVKPFQISSVKSVTAVSSVQSLKQLQSQTQTQSLRQMQRQIQKLTQVQALEQPTQLQIPKIPFPTPSLAEDFPKRRKRKGKRRRGLLERGWAKTWYPQPPSSLFGKKANKKLKRQLKKLGVM